ncbi:MAG TPA: hypothetical protein VLX58_12280 [Bryobacteraceae bacterium]|nr:hypothetical protein [Bryobacteraceae bacterium]
MPDGKHPHSPRHLVAVARLKAWGLDSTEPVATAIALSSPADVPRLIAARPQADFYLRAQDVPEIATHRKAVLPNGRILLLTPGSSHAAPRWKLPANW